MPSGGLAQAEDDGLADGWLARWRRRHNSRPIRVSVIPDKSRMLKRSSFVCTHTCALSNLEPTNRMRMLRYGGPQVSASRREPCVAMMYQVVSFSCFSSRILYLLDWRTFRATSSSSTADVSNHRALPASGAALRTRPTDAQAAATTSGTPVDQRRIWVSSMKSATSSVGALKQESSTGSRYTTWEVGVRREVR